MTPTQVFVESLESLKAGDLGRLRKHAGLDLDESVDGFDLFAALWWPLREKNQRAPRREVAWLATKLYAYCPIPNSVGATLASRLGSLGAVDERAARRRQQKFDGLLMLPLSQIEPGLQWALALLGGDHWELDWVHLIDDLSIWEREETRLNWARQYLGIAD